MCTSRCGYTLLAALSTLTPDWQQPKRPLRENRWSVCSHTGTAHQLERTRQPRGSVDTGHRRVGGKPGQAGRTWVADRCMCRREKLRRRAEKQFPLCLSRGWLLVEGHTGIQGPEMICHDLGEVTQKPTKWPICVKFREKEKERYRPSHPEWGRQLGAGSGSISLPYFSLGAGR